ncbi:MAG: adenylyl-sulfate kinase [Armatimonadota bacterium]
MESGVVIWFTGIPASGKSTLATAVQERLEAMGLPVENLDADEVRANLSPNLGYTEEARDENTKRLAWFAQKLSGYGANVMIAAVAPKRRYRARGREWCERFVEVYVECPLEVCQQRDPKGLYARAARGEVDDIAGMHQPYEAPAAPEVHVKTSESSIEECTDVVMDALQELGYLPLEPAMRQASE